MSIYSLILLPEDYGEEILTTVVLKGTTVDINGNPVSAEVNIDLNTNASEYLKQRTYAGDELQVESSETTGEWSIELPNSAEMSSDTYYHIDIKNRVFRKILSDFPLEVTLNQLEDYH